MVTQTGTTEGKRTNAGFGVAFNEALVGIGEKFNLYEALADLGPLTAKEFAICTGVPERDATFWLQAQAAADYIYYDGATGFYNVSCPWRRHN
jgi:hypothetical protein